MKTLLFTNLYPFAQAPTRGMFHVHVFRALTRYCEGRVVAPLPWWSRIKRPGEWIAAPEEDRTGISAAFPTYWTIPRLGHALHAKAMYLSLRAYVTRLRRDFPFEAILASWAYPDAVAAALIARDLGLPLVTNVLGSDINALAQIPGLRAQIQWALERSHRVIAVSGALRESVLKLGIAPERVLVQHNGVDGEKFALRDRNEVRLKLGLPQDRPILCYVGNFVPEKGVDTLVEVMVHLAEAGRKEILLALVGGGSLEPELRNMVDKHGIGGQVQFCGRRLHDEIPDWMSACDVFCLPSRREGCPNVVLEALCSGRPVVASRVGGVPELLDEANGAMVPAGDAPALARSILTTLERDWNPEALRSSVPCRSWDEVGRNYYQALASSLA